MSLDISKEMTNGKHRPANKTQETDLVLVRKHIESFPKTPSHYTRRDSRREYLDSTLTIQKMYHLYEEYCRSQTPPVKPVSSAAYRKVFGTEYNLSVSSQKKTNARYALSIYRLMKVARCS